MLGGECPKILDADLCTGEARDDLHDDGHRCDRLEDGAGVGANGVGRGRGQERRQEVAGRGAPPQRNVGLSHGEAGACSATETMTHTEGWGAVSSSWASSRVCRSSLDSL